MGFPQESKKVRLNSEPERFKIVSGSAKRSVLSEPRAHCSNGETAFS